MSCNCGNDNKKKKSQKYHKKRHSCASESDKHHKRECYKDKDCKYKCNGLLGCCAVCVKGNCKKGMLTSEGCLLNKGHKNNHYKQYKY